MDANRPGVDDLDKLGPMEEWPIGRLFAAASRLAGTVMWRQHRTSPAGFFVLRALVTEDGLRPGELARRLLISPATVTTVVDTLERNGHVERRRDERDRRALRVHINPSGLAVVSETGDAMGDDIWSLYDVVDEEDEPVVRRFLLRLIERFEEYPDRPGDPPADPHKETARDRATRD
ncbi:MarR family winged helix-turn-helix transcriptional regulator [Spirillospora sp. NPDC048911]|uniref:MarR family winged helix-turn-helix transcriptional regulator n=1 Tax=Spirillospora sp. NPDC048911 TaxID=3364527 RepID=UPI00371FCD50